MKKTLLLSVVASTLIMAGGDIAPVPAPLVVENVGTFSGQIRSYYIDRTYDKADGYHNNRNSLAFGGWLGYVSPEWNGLTFGAKLYASEGYKLHDEAYSSASFDPTLYGYSFDNYGFIGEAYLNYAFGNTNLKVGRQRLDTPLAAADDARMLPSLFEAAVLSNTDITNTTLIAAHVTRMTTGGLANAYYTVNYDKNPTGDPMQQPASKLGIHGGYGFGSPHASSGNFDNMGRVALGGDTSTDGVTALAAIYANDNLKLQAWDYIAWDILNAIYLQADYTFNVSETSNVTASAQYINESDIGDAYASKVDTNLFGVKLAGNMGNLSAFAAYSQTDDNDDNYGVVSPWGGAPVFTTGMVTRHEMLPDSSVWKVGVGYKLPEYGIKASAYYAEYTVGNSGAQKILGGTASEWTTKEPGFDIQYDVASIKGLNLRFRGNFPREFTPTYTTKDSNNQDVTKYSTDWNEYRFIVNYSF